VRLVIASFPEELLEAVLTGLTHQRVHGVSISHVRGFGQEHDEGHPDYRSFTAVEVTRKVRIEIACHDNESDGIMDAIYKSAHTGRRGNGKILVIPIFDALRLKTGERGPAAIGIAPDKTSGD
jgi:nitrogen regulatory protein P-II 1